MAATSAGCGAPHPGLSAVRVEMRFPDAPVRRFVHPLRVLVARRLTEVADVLLALDAEAAAGRSCVGFVSYDAAAAFDPAFPVSPHAELPLAWFAVFDACDAEVVDEADDPVADAHGCATRWMPATGRDDYDRAIARIRDGIANGNFYQINFTFPMRAGGVEPRQLWRHLRSAQPGSYAAYIDTGDHIIVSASPELFFERDGCAIETRPMKGTAPRGRWPAEDDDRAAALSASEKERAENLMIVDLVRNDLSRIATTGSVRVTRLCTVERWATVLQMTSTVRATLRPETSTCEIFQALFPAGSVTGAPKVAAMRAIAALEKTPRGVYCGAIGCVEPGRRATFNVAIRTATLRHGRGEYRVGGGITWDSTAHAEYAEALAKSRVLHPRAARPAFHLVETLRLDDGELVRLDRHLARMRASALYFGWSDPGDAARAALRDPPSRGVWRARVLADERAVRVEYAPLATDSALRFRLASRPVDSSDPFLFHKTSLAGTAPLADGAVELRWNERQELTEFAIGNLVVCRSGELFTPPVDAGLLPGIFRAELLEHGAVTERPITPGDLANASAIWLVNSLRGWVRALPA